MTREKLHEYFRKETGLAALRSPKHYIAWLEKRFTNHLPDVSKLMYVLDTIDSQREETSDNFVAVNDGNIRNHWDFRQGAKWAIEAIKLGVADHLPETGNKVEPFGDSGEKKIFTAGWEACESHFNPFSEIGGAPLQLAADYKEWTNKTQTK